MEKRPMHNEENMKLFPELLVHFVLLLLLLFVVARFFETMNTFYQYEFPLGYSLD